MKYFSSPVLRLSLFLVVLNFAVSAIAQAPMPIYTDRLVNGFESWSWGANDFANPSPVHAGTSSIAFQGVAWEALSFRHSEFNAEVYGDFEFWAHGGPNGGQQVQLIHQPASGGGGPGYLLPALPAGAWQKYTVPLSSLGVVGNLHRIHIQLTSFGSTANFYVDDVRLAAVPAPATVHVAVDASAPVRTADTRWFGANTAIWDGNFEQSQTVPLLEEMGTTTLRFPGGSLSDQYFWRTGKSSTNTWQWVTSFADFAHAATSIAAEVFITVNYGTSTPEDAAGWVRHANITNNLGITYWEIGNENYGTWEADDNVLPHHAYTYATRAQQYIQQMKAADPSIQVGVVVAPGEDSYDNGYTDHPALNPRTLETHYGWTPVLLSTLKDLGVTPDFAVHHHYPQWTPQNPTTATDSDPFLLQSAANWAQDAANLRQQIEDYFGPGGTNIELVVTENNSDAGSQGRQSTSLVNGLYYADSLGQLMKTEFNALVWWDLRNGTDTGGSFDSTLYGWRTYGDLGMINGLNTRHPTFYTAKLMQHHVRGGDTVLGTSSDYALLSAYAARRANGALSLLVLNKDTITNLNAEITITGFAPDASAAVRSYGIPQDEAARTNGPAALQDIAVATFTNADETFTFDFPPLSMTVFALAPEPSLLVPVPPVVNDTMVIELHGQSNVPYTIQGSSNAIDWLSHSTNTPAGDTIVVTNPTPPGAATYLFRANWQP